MGSREIYNVRYQLGEAKIYDETPFVAGTTMAANSGKEAATVSVSMAYEDERSYSFNNSSSTTDGAPTTLRAGVPSIVGDSILIGDVIAISPFKWGQTTTTTTSVEAADSISVPPNSVATISYGGTKGKCDVPFSYTQRDTSPSGTVVTTDNTDGIFKGSNYYNLKFNVDNIAART